MLQAKKLKDKMSVDFHSVPHAVFTNRQVAAVGLTESEAIDAGYKVLVGRAKHMDVAKGVAMAEKNGFVKVVVEEKTGKILGCSAVGAGASELVQQVVYLMNTDRQDLEPLSRSQIIHPTLNEVLAHAFVNLARPSSLP